MVSSNQHASLVRAGIKWEFIADATEVVVWAKKLFICPSHQGHVTDEANIIVNYLLGRFDE